MLADRAVPRLLDETAELVDLETVRLTAQPSALAHRLLRMRAAIAVDLANGDHALRARLACAQRVGDSRGR